MKVREMCLTALMAALICVVAPLAVPVGPIPVSLATFMLYLAGALLGGKCAVAATALYILIGAVGLPVFSGFSGGFQKIAGATGGYIVGYLPMVAIIGFSLDRWSARGWVYPVSMLLGTVCLYTLGTAWFMAQSGASLLSALSSCVLLFIPGDLVKIGVAAAVGMNLRHRLAILRRAAQ